MDKGFIYIQDKYIICRTQTNSNESYFTRSYLCYAQDKEHKKLSLEKHFQNMYNFSINKIPKNTIWLTHDKNKYNTKNNTVIKTNEKILHEFINTIINNPQNTLKYIKENFFILHVHEKHASCSSKSCFLVMSILKYQEKAYLKIKNLDLRTYTLPGFPFDTIETFLQKYSEKSFQITTDISTFIETSIMELFFVWLIIKHCKKFKGVSFLGIVLGWIFADFNSNLVHHMGDNAIIQYKGNEFEISCLMAQQHHLEPIGINKENFVLQIYKSGRVSLALCIIQKLFPDTNFYSSFFIVNNILSTHGHLFHRLAHLRNHNFPLSQIILFLQDRHIILNHKEHSQHHTSHEDNFSIVNGVTNKFMNMLPYDKYKYFIQKLAQILNR
jgi:hypothetical protein